MANTTDEKTDKYLVPKGGRVSIRLPPWLYRKLLEVCEDEKMGLTEAIVKALKHTYVAERVDIHLAPPTE
jgi:hypothetical protein